MQRGYCSHPHKKCRIVTEWKCVDIRFPTNISREESDRRRAECKAKDYFGVCHLCKEFTPEAGTEAVKASGVQPTQPQVPSPEPEKKPVYTPTPKQDDIIDIDNEMYM